MLNFEEIRKQFKSPSEEIAFLKSILEAQHETDKNNVENTSTFLSYKRENKADKEFRVSNLLGKYKNLDSEKVLGKKYMLSDEHVTTVALGLEPEDHDDKLQKIINILISDGLKNSFAVLSKMKNPHLEDDFHRFLVQYILNYAHDGKINKYKDTVRSLESTLYQVILPTDKSEAQSGNSQQSGPQNQEANVKLMERFYSGMMALATSVDDDKNKNYFTLEIAKPQNSSQIKFYVSVPNNFKDLFQKQVLALYPQAKIMAEIDDYNIFNSNENKESYSLGAYGTPGKTPALPIKTYKEIGGDSISVVLSVLTQLNDTNEGAAVQIVVRPAGQKFIKEYGTMLDKIRKGSSLKKVLNEKTFLGSIKQSAYEMFKGENSEKNQASVSHVEEAATKLISEKLSSTIFNTNIRIVTSSESPVRSAQIMQEVASSFKQYTESLGNSIKFKEIKQKSASQFFKHFSFRFFDEYESFPLNVTELATLYHFPKGVSDRDFSELSQYDSASAPAPADLPKDGIFLGNNEYRHLQNKIFFQKESRVRHMYVIGQTGTGKSKFLQNMIIQDIKNGQGICFMDPHGADLEEILTHIPKERIDDVVYFDPSDLTRPFGLNMLEYDPAHPEQKTLIVNELLLIFNKLFDMKVAGGPAFEQYFRNSALLVMEHPESGCTLLEISRVLSDQEFRHMKLEHCQNPMVKQFFQNAEATSGEQGFENYVPYVTNKFDNFLSNEFLRPIISQEKSSFNITDIMDNKKILLVNLSKGKLGELGSYLIGLIIVGKILVAALARDPKKDPPPFYLYLDEFQNVASDSIAQILSEARKYKLGLTIAHQFIEQLPKNIKDAVFGNVGSMAIFRINPEDAKFIENYFSPTFSAKDIIGQSVGNCYLKLLANNSPQKPFNLYTPLQQKGDDEVRDVVKELSSLKYGLPKDEVDEMIMKKFDL